MACTVLLCAIDDEKGPQLYKCDPSGHYFGYKAAALGSKEAEAASHLEKIVKKTNVSCCMFDFLEYSWTSSELEFVFIEVKAFYLHVTASKRK